MIYQLAFFPAGCAVGWVGSASGRHPHPVLVIFSFAHRTAYVRERSVKMDEPRTVRRHARYSEYWRNATYSPRCDQSTFYNALVSRAVPRDDATVLRHRYLDWGIIVPRLHIHPPMAYVVCASHANLLCCFFLIKMRSTYSYGKVTFVE